MNVKKKLGPFPAWVWGVIVLGAIAAFYIYKRRSSGGGGSSAILSGGVLPQDMASAGAPAENAAPAASLSPDVVSALNDLNASVGQVSAGQDVISAEIAALGAQNVAATSLAPPATTSGPNGRWRPSSLAPFVKPSSKNKASALHPHPTAKPRAAQPPKAKPRKK